MATSHPRITIIAPTIVRFSYMLTMPSGRPASNVIDVSLDEFGTDRATAVRDLADKMNSPYQIQILGGLPSQVHFTGAHYIDLDSATGITGMTPPHAGDPVVGGRSGAMDQANTAILVHKQSDAARGHRNGRWFLPGILSTDSADDGTLVSSILSSTQTGVNAYKTAIEGIGLPLGFTVATRVVHVTAKDSDGNPTAWNSTDISSFVVDPKVATQRRRLRK
jgi:hypothetical protein